MGRALVLWVVVLGVVLCDSWAAPHPLTPRHLEDDISLTQIVSSITASTSMEAQAAYRQLSAATTLLSDMHSQIRAAQTSDDENTMAVLAAHATDEAALVIAAGKAAEAVRAQSTVVSNIETQRNGVQAVMATTNATLLSTRESLARTQEACQGILDYRHAHIAAAKNDIDTIEHIQGMIQNIKCPINVAVEEMDSDSTSNGKTKGPVNDNVDPRSRTRDCQGTACDTPGGTSAITDTEVEYACGPRKAAMNTRIEELRAQLYGMASQDTHTFESTYTLCVQDITAQENSELILTRKHGVLTGDEDRLFDQEGNAKVEFASLEASRDAADEVLAATQANINRIRCRFKKRKHLRIRQSELVEKVVGLLKDLHESPYAPTHASLVSGCAASCEVHGMCFNGICHCDHGWKGPNCTVTTAPGTCHFTPNSPPCVNPLCLPFVSMGTLRSIPSTSECAAVMCDHCRSKAGVNDTGCLEAPVALFCAEKERRDGCESVTCPADDRRCGTKRIRRNPLRGCCFNPTLDCEDECFKVTCPDVDPRQCRDGLTVRYPLRNCCFDASVDCVDTCALAECSTAAPSCPGGSTVRSPYIGCCFDAALDCDDDCTVAVCDDDLLPVEECSKRGMRWSGSNQGCCFDADADCVTGDVDGQEGDRLALKSLYSATEGRQWTRKNNWDSELWVCLWHGVRCAGSSEKMRISELQLSSNNLNGVLPITLAQLTKARLIDLSFNSLTGPLPSDFVVMDTLEVLKVNNNALTGVVPAWTSLQASLTVVYINSNYFTDFEAPAGSRTSPDKSLVCDVNCFCHEPACDDPRNAATFVNQACVPCTSNG